VSIVSSDPYRDTSIAVQTDGKILAGGHFNGAKRIRNAAACQRWACRFFLAALFLT